MTRGQTKYMYCTMYIVHTVCEGGGGKGVSSCLNKGLKGGNISYHIYTVRKEIKCSGETELYTIHELVHDTQRISS